MIDFKNYVTRESFENCILDNMVDDKLINEIEEQIKIGLKDASFNMFLKPLIFSDIHKTNFSLVWNKLIKNDLKDDDYVLKRNLDYFIKELVYNQLIVVSRNINKNDKEELKNKFIDFIDYFNKGNFKSFESPSGICVNCGTSLNIKFKNWEGKFFEFKDILDVKDYRKVVPENSPNNFLNKMDFFEASACFEEKVQIKEFEFKTENIIITDWIRLKEFTDNVESEKDFEINSAKGRAESFQHYLNKGFISVSSGAGFNIFTPYEKDFENCFVFGRTNYSDEVLTSGDVKSTNFKEKNQINGPLRAVTIIEEEKLLDIINKSINDMTKSKELLNEYIKENKDEITKTKINPDVYNIIFDSTNKSVSDLLFPINIDNTIEPRVLLYPKSLSPHLENTKKNFKM